MSILKDVWTTHNGDYTTLSLKSNSPNPIEYGHILITDAIIQNSQVVVIPLLSDEDLAAIYFAIGKELGY